MQENEVNNLRLNLVNAIATSVIALSSLIGLLLAITEFLETKNEVFGFEKVTFISVALLIILSIIIYRTKRWIYNE